MIADWDTNRLFLSDRLEAGDPQLVASLRSAVDGAAVEVIPETSDVWCRDYMPVQLSENSFCQFTYQPSSTACMSQQQIDAVQRESSLEKGDIPKGALRVQHGAPGNQMR
jgi:hypothetical protein